MNRRDSMKGMLIGTLAGTSVLKSCSTPESKNPVVEVDAKYYGRTPEELAIDAKLQAQQFFTVHELETIATLCDLILPKNEQFGSASEAGVPEFIEFMAKDFPRHQIPIRGGIMWLDNRSNKKYNSLFKNCKNTQHKSLLDEIAYPDQASPSVSTGVKFFSLMRDLTITGYYTTRMGFDELGYKGNQPNVWEGVPQEILNEHGFETRSRVGS